MYNHALRKREELELTPAEQFDTRTKMSAHMILMAVGILSVVMSQLLPSQIAGLSGFTYFLIGPSFYFFYSIRERRRRKLHGKK